MKLNTMCDEDYQLPEGFPEQGWQRREKRRVSKKQIMKKHSRNLFLVYKNAVLKRMGVRL